MLWEELEAIFFDFDGVILDSARIKSDAFSELFSEFGQSIVAQVLKHHRQYGGISRVQKIAHYYESLLDQPLSTDELARECARFSQLVKDKVIATNYIRGVPEFLEKYHQQVPFFIISGTPQDELVDIIEKRGMATYFKEILGSPTLKPVHVRNLVRQYGLQPEKCIFIGDALTDYHTATETGTKFIGIQGEITFPDPEVVLPDGIGLESAILAL